MRGLPTLDDLGRRWCTYLGRPWPIRVQTDPSAGLGTLVGLHICLLGSGRPVPTGGSEHSEWRAEGGQQAVAGKAWGWEPEIFKMYSMKERAAGTRVRAGGRKPGKRDVNRPSFSTNRQHWPRLRAVAAQGSEGGTIVGKRTRAGAKGLIDNKSSPAAGARGAVVQLGEGRPAAEVRVAERVGAEECAASEVCAASEWRVQRRNQVEAEARWAARGRILECSLLATDPQAGMVSRQLMGSGSDIQSAGKIRDSILRAGMSNRLWTEPKGLMTQRQLCAERSDNTPRVGTTEIPS
ncbi:hypothetical protein FB451DRAFT_1371711 [Mycena latifolia]|nr:hypothetical protein FB451DRAFT_1371711 [Mycena latifolia]